MPTKLNHEVIAAAILGFEEQKRHIDSQISELRAMLSGGPAESATTPEPTKRKGRKMSAAGRKAIAEAQRKRWADSKNQSGESSEKAKPKRKLSAAGRKAISDATKKRWALKRAEAANAQPVAAKKATPKRSVAKAAAKVKKTAATLTVAQTGG